MVNTLGRTDPPMMGSGWTIKLTVMELICGKMGANIGVSGHKMTCRDTASTSTLMEYVTTGNTWLTRKKGTECTIGLMQHGLGTYIDSAKSSVKYGLWENGKRVKWFDE